MRSTSADVELASHLRIALARTARRLRQEAGTGLSPSLTAALATIERHGPLTPSASWPARERVQRPTADADAGRGSRRRASSRAPPTPATAAPSLIAVTPAGRELLAAARTRKDAFLSERLDALGAEDRATLERAAALLEGMLE